jgi:hypothetical protein
MLNNIRRSVSACLRARESRNSRGMLIGPAIENAHNVKDSSDGCGVSALSHAQSCTGPCRSTEAVRTVSRSKNGSGASRPSGRTNPGRRYSVSRATRVGNEARISGMALLGAPFSRRSRRCGSCESTAIRMVAGTPAQRYIACIEPFINM